MVISDIEMPEMDGYTFTAEIRHHDALKHLYVLLHSSLSGVFNEAMVNKVGADKFLAKFNPDELVRCVSDRVLEMNGENLLRSEEHTSELQSRGQLVCRLLLEKEKQ